jgi:hypothetical protein
VHDVVQSLIIGLDPPPRKASRSKSAGKAK